MDMNGEIVRIWEESLNAGEMEENPAVLNELRPD
jgi:hypothetical protein